MRLQRNTALLERQFAGACAEAPAARPRPTQVAVLTATLDRPGGPPPSSSRPWSTRRRPGRVWPSQRAPPTHNRMPNPRVAETEVMP
jgi:hypothetical protein